MLEKCDVLVIGGGPAGSTVSTLLARRGFSVTVLEKDVHPRFHIGESLLPANLPILHELGVADEVEAIGMRKWGIEFVSPAHSTTSLLEFADAWDKSLNYSYQVRRSEFDELLLRNAQRNGVQVLEGERALAVEFDDADDADGGTPVRVTSACGDSRRHWQARFLVDASGRDTFLANRFKCKLKNRKHNSSALFAHFEGVERLPGRLEGNISIFWFEHGWFWLIPLHDGITSIGAVCWPYYLKSRKGSVEQFLLQTIASCPALAQRTRNARIAGHVQATGNYSYSSTHSYGRRYVMIGDAYAFIDPVFSSGVYLAMSSAAIGADAIETCLNRPADAAAALARFDREVRRGPREFSWFIYRVTNPTMRELFMAPRNVLRTKEALLGLLAGHIHGTGAAMRAALLAFKAVYYATSLANLRRTIAAWRRRKANIRDDRLPESS
ncbi:MAG TPA: NAD(P)/FAD-dependent oxidoreductase [Burkholderiaceae bacterium]|nr:NAD(P)/FAD-dependent oxidoreductase [Burkholderiaceae bacterium]